jgi:hypothetical protein
MPSKLKRASTQAALERVLEALKQELVDTPDEEITAAAQELGMNLELPESGAFAGLTYPARWHLSDFFELEAFRQMQLEEDERIPGTASATSMPARPRRNVPRGKRADAVRSRKTRKDHR